MRLRAAVANGQVWGIGFTDGFAIADAALQFEALSKDPAIDQSTAPTEELSFCDITLEDALRVTNGDRRLRGV